MGGTCKISQGSTQICHKNQLFTEEALCTALHQIGSLLSSGPFTSSSDDIRDYKYLIPNHFLIGKQSPNYHQEYSVTVKLTNKVNGGLYKVQYNYFGRNS